MKKIILGIVVIGLSTSTFAKNFSKGSVIESKDEYSYVSYRDVENTGICFNRVSDGGGNCTSCISSFMYKHKRR